MRDAPLPRVKFRRTKHTMPEDVIVAGLYAMLDQRNGTKLTPYVRFRRWWTRVTPLRRGGGKPYIPK